MSEWISAKAEKPRPFDLCLLECIDSTIIKGWYTGGGWDGAKYDGQEIISWQRLEGTRGMLNAR
jgi:hypothetical protein